MRAGSLLALAFVLASAAPPAAVIVRHDRSDDRYVELGRQLEGICHLNLQSENAPPDGEGVLIDPFWVLTAAHVGVEIGRNHLLTVVGSDSVAEIEADTVFVHPEWEGGPRDIALVRLKRAVEKIEPVPVYRLRDEAGKIIIIGGTGDFGTGETGPTGNDGKLRAATNRVDEVSDNWLKFRFDAPGRAADLEGVSGPGDSGGPAFIRAGDARYVAGVSSGQSTRDTGGREGVYGVREYYTRVSSCVDWIDRIMREMRPPEK